MTPAPATQLQPVEFSGTTPDDRLERLRTMKDWIRRLKRIQTPNPKTVH